MDPNATYRLMMELADSIADGRADDSAATELAELVIALDEWIAVKRGFLPNAWIH